MQQQELLIPLAVLHCVTMISPPHDNVALFLNLTASAAAYGPIASSDSQPPMDPATARAYLTQCRLGVCPSLVLETLKDGGPAGMAALKAVVPVHLLSRVEAWEKAIVEQCVKLNLDWVSLSANERGAMFEEVWSPNFQE